MSEVIRVNGMRMGVEARGEPGARARLVLLHGFTGSAAGWGEHLDRLAADGLRGLTFDLPGHGDADAPGDPAMYSIERSRANVVAAARHYGLSEHDRCNVLLGYSMGGRVALYTAFDGSFQAVILESASPGIADERERAARRAADECLAASIERDGVPAFVDVWERLPLWESQRQLPAERRAILREQRLRNRAVGLANSLRGVGTGAQPSLWERLPELRIPVLLIVGALDAKFRRIAEQMAGRLPHARLAVVPDAGHAAHFERPEVFDAIVSDFCRTVIQRGAVAAKE